MIEKRNKQYRARVYIGLDHGKKIWQSGPLRSTQREAKQDEAALIRQKAVRRAIGITSTPATFGELAEQVLHSPKYAGYTDRTKMDWDY